MRRFPHNQRAGVVLIVVLGILALFALVGITFLLSTEQGLVSAQAVARIEQGDDPPETILERALAQVLVGSTNQHSVLQNHSLLEDLYGQHAVESFVANFNPGYLGASTNNAGLIRFQVPAAALESNGGTFRELPNYYHGRVLTMITGNCAGKSGRILRYFQESGGSDWYITLLAFEGMQASGGTWVAATAPSGGDQYIINGAPFNGMGCGYDAEKFIAGGLLNLTARDLIIPRTNGDVLAPNLDPDATPGNDSAGERVWAGLLDAELALMPNPRSPEWQALLGPTALTSQYAPVHADEDYDAVDFQNMLLSMQVNQSGAGVGVVNALTTIPSLHRPDLIAFWENRISSLGLTAAEERALSRRISLRPQPFDHPVFFSTTNSTYDPIAGPWDVDNDLDGIPDSIWVDLGFEAQRNEDGRMYKPLVALMVRDMDGRLNINAHGQLNEYYDDNSIPVNPLDGAALSQKGVYHWYQGNDPQGNPQPPKYSAAGVPTTQNLTSTGQELRMSTGMGLSPAEITLTPYTLNNAANRDVPSNRNFVLLEEEEFRYLLQGRVLTDNSRIAGRYGETYVETTVSGQTILVPRPGRSADLPPADRIQDGDDNYPPEPSAFSHQFAGSGGKPFGNYRPNQEAAGGLLTVPRNNLYGTPYDLDGNGAIFVDPAGHPRFYYMGKPNGVALWSEHIDDATELNLVDSRTYAGPSGLGIQADEPFTPSDLDWLLRPFDQDVEYSLDTVNTYATQIAGTSRATSSRLRWLLRNNTQQDMYKRSLLTTESWDIPVPSYIATPEIAAGLANLGEPANDLTFMDLVRGKIAFVNGLTVRADVDAILIGPHPSGGSQDLFTQGLFNYDLGMNLRLNVNRPLGNGFDDDGDGIVDENDEIGNEPVFGSTPGAAQTDRVPDAQINTTDLAARTLLARQLYFLMMLVKDHNYIETIPDNITPTNAQRQEMTARRIAQWAVNAVDFRDQDNIMTGFEYDVNPFDGWSVDGDLTTPDRIGGSANPQRRVVWGCEQPVAVLTESVAMHDLRLDDTDRDPSNQVYGPDPADDKTWDQMRIPKGDTFIEIQSVANDNIAQFAGDLFESNGTLNLAKLDATNGLSPVWRLVITKPTYVNPQEEGFNPSQARDAHHVTRMMNDPTQADLWEATGSFEPDQSLHHPAGLLGGLNNVEAYQSDIRRFNLLDSVTAREVDPERYVYFVTRNQFNAVNAGLRDDYGGATVTADSFEIYTRLNNTDIPGLAPGQYALVGSASRLLESADATNSTRCFLGDPSMPLVIEMGANPAPQTWAGGQYVGNAFISSSTTTTPLAPFDAVGDDPNSTIRPVIGVPCAHLSDVTVGANNIAMQIGLNISEPLFVPTDMNSWYRGDLAGRDITSTPYTVDSNPVEIFDTINPPVDDYFDDNNNRVLESNQDFETTQLTTKELPNFTHVFLQRLADPTQAWDPVSNPYLSVDWMPIDLTVYNSERSGNGNGGAGSGGFNNNSQPIVSKERGPNFWSQANNFVKTTSPQIDQSFRNSDLRCSLGFLNGTISGTRMMGTTMNSYGDASLLGFPEDRVMPWLAWNNRPYVSGLELMQVPASSPARLLWEFSTYQTISGNNGGFAQNTFQGEHGISTLDPTQPLGGAPYRHLLSFLFAGTANPATNLAAPFTAATGTTPAANYHRVFEFLTVPSRFSGTTEFLNPAIYFAGNSDSTGDLRGLTAPYNYVSRYREPGKVNLNTISDSQEMTWACILGSVRTQENLTNYWFDVAASRRGYGDNPASQWWNNNQNFPTIFANPFRSFTNAYYVPLDNMRQANSSYRPLTESTLLRPRRFPTSYNFDPPSGVSGDDTGPLFANNFNVNNAIATDGQSGPFNDPRQHSYFQFDPIQRMPNLVTTKSNVYAVWLTVGFFEVKKVTVDPNLETADPPAFREFQEAYPDGYRLEAELGSDDGEVTRHRGFYIIDRSLPVAFQRGKLHNAMNAVIYKRTLQ